MTLNQWCLLGWVVLSCPLCSVAQSRPHALEMALRQRQRLKTGQVELFWRNERELRLSRFFTGRFAGDDNIMIHRRDNDGEAVPVPDDGPKPEWRPPHCVLRTQNESWQYDSDIGPARLARLGEARTQGENVFRMRGLGTDVTLSYGEFEELLASYERANPAPAGMYHETLENGLYVVTAETSGGGTYTWWIDGERDWSVVRAAVSRDGKIGAEARTKLKNFDGVWYPETVEYFDLRYKNGQEPGEVVYVYSAAFNRPDQPRGFAPADIGIECGMSIQAAKPDGGVDIVMWDGKKTVSQEEYARRYDAGELKDGPTLQRLRTQDRVARRNTIESQWARYTRQFIVQYALDLAQTQRALTILSDCEEQARNYIARHREEFERAEARLSKPAESRSTQAADAQVTAAGEINKLMEPLDEIMRKELVPRLDTLPTRAQREAVKAASQPTTKRSGAG
jgi:hypothetical protein